MSSLRGSATRRLTLLSGCRASLIAANFTHSILITVDTGSHGENRQTTKGLALSIILDDEGSQRQPAWRLLSVYPYTVRTARLTIHCHPPTHLQSTSTPTPWNLDLVVLVTLEYSSTSRSGPPGRAATAETAVAFARALGARAKRPPGAAPVFGRSAPVARRLELRARSLRGEGLGL